VLADVLALRADDQPVQPPPEHTAGGAVRLHHRVAALRMGQRPDGNPGALKGTDGGIGQQLIAAARILRRLRKIVHAVRQLEDHMADLRSAGQCNQALRVTLVALLHLPDEDALALQHDPVPSQAQPALLL